MMLFTGFALFVLGQTFMVESTVGIIYSTLFALVCLNVDRQFYKYLEKNVLDIYKSRRFKFYAMFFCTFLFAGNIIFKTLSMDDVFHKQSWMLTP
mmetsp:Transcript_24419/g.21675  ORF Transcript_24419/g.21675 Transcript_24419/m.21675 type:complete len:95 (-) Transcript_24419:601-885(-)